MTIAQNRAVLLILFIALICRLFHVTFPVAGFQGWRQADTAAIAKNYYENGFDFLHPQIDWGGNTQGYVETEFPLVPFLIALLYKFFSPVDALGRLFSIICALITIYGLYLLVRKTLGQHIALLSSLIYAILPLNIYYSRAVMPESAMLMCSVLGIYYFSEWLDRERTSAFILAAGFISLAALLKLTSLYLGLPLLYLTFSKFKKRTLLQRQLWLFALIVLVPVVLWYYHAHQIYLQSGLSFGIWDYGTGKWGKFGPLFTFKFYNDVFLKSIAERHLTYTGFVALLMGLFIKRKQNRELLFDWWLIAVLLYFAIVTVGNQVHEYYQLPFTLPASVSIAKTLHKLLFSASFRELWRTRRVVTSIVLLCAIAIPILSFLRYFNYMRGEDIEGPIFKLDTAVHAYTQPTDLVVAVDEGDPVILYRAGRKGWHGSPENLSREILFSLKQQGAKYLIGRKDYFDDGQRPQILAGILNQYPIVSQGDAYFIVSLKNL